MKKLGFLVLCLLLLNSCSTSKTTVAGHPRHGNAPAATMDGSTYEKAVIIMEKSESTGTAAEYKWLKDHYPGYTMQMQSLTHYKNKPYDILQVTTAAGIRIEVFFDISNFFGKF